MLNIKERFDQMRIKLAKLFVGIVVLFLAITLLSMLNQKDTSPPGGELAGEVVVRAYLHEGIVTHNLFFIEPLEVVEDSRCPVNVVCIWEGTFALNVNAAPTWVSKSTYPTEFRLNEPKMIDGYTVTLVSVEPAARSGYSISPSDYIFEFTIKNEQ